MLMLTYILIGLAGLVCSLAILLVLSVLWGHVLGVSTDSDTDSHR
jgi:hypothetical protein